MSQASEAGFGWLEKAFAAECRRLFERGPDWTNANLFNGDDDDHRIELPADARAIHPGLLIGTGSADVSRPDYQLGPGCLVD